MRCKCIFLNVFNKGGGGQIYMRCKCIFLNGFPIQAGTYRCYKKYGIISLLYHK